MFQLFLFQLTSLKLNEPKIKTKIKLKEITKVKKTKIERKKEKEKIKLITKLQKIDKLKTKIINTSILSQYISLKKF